MDEVQYEVLMFVLLVICRGYALGLGQFEGGLLTVNRQAVILECSAATYSSGLGVVSGV